MRQKGSECEAQSVSQRQGKYPKWQTMKNMSINDKTAKIGLLLHMYEVYNVRHKQGKGRRKKRLRGQVYEDWTSRVQPRLQPGQQHCFRNWSAAQTFTEEGQS